MSAISTERIATARWPIICTPGRTRLRDGRFVLRNTLSDFGGVARGVCQVDSDGYLESILELKNIERDGGHARDTDAAGRETQAHWRRNRLHEYVGIQSPGVPATQRAFREFP